MKCFQALLACRSIKKNYNKIYYENYESEREEASNAHRSSSIKGIEKVFSDVGTGLAC